MRPAMLRKLNELMELDDSVYVLTADTGFHVFDEFQEQYPDRYLNVGIAEASMISMASGLALAGKKVFVYGIVPFVTMRCFEQIRVDLCYPKLPVKIVGVGGGMTYGGAGMTHHSIEDVAVMRCLPDMTVICPGDPAEAYEAVAASMELEGPCYLRLGKSGEPVVHEDGLDEFAIGRGIRVRNGAGLAIIATGAMLKTASEACELLVRRGADPELISMHTVKPLDRALLVDLARRCHTIATVEEHSVIGGLGSAVAEVVAQDGLNVSLRAFGVPDVYAHESGSQQYFRRQYGLTAEAITDDLLQIEENATSREGGRQA